MPMWNTFYYINDIFEGFCSSEQGRCLTYDGLWTRTGNGNSIKAKSRPVKLTHSGFKMKETYHPGLKIMDYP